MALPLDPLRRFEPEAAEAQRAVGPVPPPAPLAMPVQSLTVHPRVPRVRASFRVHLARLLTFGGALAVTILGAREMYAVVDIGGIGLLKSMMVALFSITFGWIALSATATLAGVLLGWQRRRADEALPIATRTALIMPVYNEEPARTFAGLQAMAEALIGAGHGQAFEIFVLSDTTDADVWLQETTAFARLRNALRGDMCVWYRRRYENTARKAGNVQDFVERWGARYDFMIVLDADSIVEAHTLLTMVREMQADERLGILQTVPLLANGHGLLPRLQQFASRLYGPVIARGIAAWQGPDGNYWGHNAIIRVRAFAETCGLPLLPGRPPMGGTIQSHDFVEAALMRRGGWSVRMLSGLEGSWEESPPSLLDAAARDRRWAQGNLQHLAVVDARGLTWPSRMHLLIGVMSYLASPLWLALIVVGLTLAVQAALIRPEYFTADFQLFPTWPVFDTERMIRLFAVTMGVLLLPKAVGFVRALFVRSLRRPIGIFRLFAGAVAELVLSALYAPSMMIIQCRQLVEIVRGRDSGWSTQRRGTGTTPWGEIVRRHWMQTLIGIALSAGLAALSLPLLAWMSPTLAGLLLAIPLSRASGSPRAGTLLRRLGLLVIPEEVEHPPLMQRRAEIETDLAPVIAAATIERLARDSAARSAHFHTLLPRPPRRPGTVDVDQLTARAKVEQATTVREALSWLTPRERVALLADAALFARLEELENR